jgi:ATP-dependent Clp protease ATP-binding subunit ClpA
MPAESAAQAGRSGACHFPPGRSTIRSMLVRLVLHVRSTDSGTLVVTPVDFPRLTRNADDFEGALAALRPALLAALARIDAFDRAALEEPPAAELLRLPIEVPAGARKTTVGITLGVVAMERVVSGRLVTLVRAPAAPALELALPGRDGLEEQAARAAVKVLRRWQAHSILAADEPQDARLEVIELELPQSVDSNGGEDDDRLLDELGQDLTARAEEGRIGGIDGRDDLVRRVLGVLASSGRSSVLLVGPREVGKTALLHEIAQRLVAGAVPEPLRGRRLWRISANELIAGAQYTGQWQERVRKLIEEIRAGNVICAMDDPIPIIDAGRWSRGDNNVSRFLRPYMESGDITIVCESTPEQVAAAHAKEPSFIDAFHRVEVAEPSLEEAREITAAAAARLASRTAVDIAADAVEAAIELTRRYEPYRGFPGKAVRLLEDTVRERQEGASVLGRQEVTAEFAHRTGLPLVLLSDPVELELAEVRKHFESRVLGQPEAVGAMVALISVLKAGLAAPGKPLGSFFFVGPTGVGKTELAKALAEFLFGSRERVLRIDMGEYGAGDAVAKLIGSGWRDSSEGELTRRIREQPFSVVLLDEIEKAHWSVFDALLAVLGEGRLTNAAGQTADFRNAIVIMTSNLGATRSRSPGVGFSSAIGEEQEQLRRHYVEQAEAFFRPEFFNRIDQLVVFQPLEEAVVRQIARRELGRLLMREGVVRRRLLVEVDDSVIDVLARDGFHPQYGARPLHRQLEQAVIQPLARLIVDKHPAPGQLARIHLRGQKVAIELDRIAEAARVSEPPRPRLAHTDGTFAKAVRATRELQRRLQAETEASTLQALRDERSQLVLDTNMPTFWDEPERARSTLARIYQVEHVLDRFDVLLRRAAGLVELAKQLSTSRMKPRLREVWAALDEIEDALAASRLEIAGTAFGSRGAAVVRVIPVGDAADAWALELFGMYCAWAERTGRELQRDEEARSAQVGGPSTLELLAGETGLHRRLRPDRTTSLARVVVTAANEEEPQDEEADDAAVVVRVYEDGRRRVVRDLRTGTRETHLNAVLEEGRIDAFLLAWLRHQRKQDELPGA